MLKISAVSDGEFKEIEHKALSKNDTPKLQYEVKQGDFLMTRGNTPDLVGDVCVVGDVRKGLLISDLIYRINYKSTLIDIQFILLWLLSSYGRKQISSEAQGSSLTMVKVSQKLIKEWIVLLPPIDEQKEIIHHIYKDTNKIDDAVTRAKNEIELIKEYRTRLISDVVTGKIDVRDVPVEDVDLDELETVDEIIEQEEEMVGVGEEPEFAIESEGN